MFLRQNIVEPFSAKDVSEDLQAGIVGTMPNKRPSPRRSVHSTFKYWTLIDYNVLKYQTANEIFWESINIILLVLKKTRNHSSFKTFFRSLSP